MASRTSWTAGNGVGLSWTAVLNSSDMQGLSTANTVLGTPTVTNSSSLDQFMDLSVRCSITASTITAGANIVLWLYPLLDDGATYGDGQLSAGTGVALTPTFPPVAVIPLVAASTQTKLVGASIELVIPPGNFKIALQNNSGFTLATTTQNCLYRTYNINLND
jgi:hypothetical protein